MTRAHAAFFFSRQPGCGVAILVAMLMAVCPVYAQSAPPAPAMPGAPPAFGNVNPTEQTDRLAEKMARERNADRQKQIVEETNQLLKLAQQLKDAVDKSSKDQLSLDVINRAAEIEKLAKSVKNKMKAEEGTPAN